MERYSCKHWVQSFQLLQYQMVWQDGQIWYQPRPGGRLNSAASGLFIALVIQIPAVSAMGPSAHLKENSCAEPSSWKAPAAAFLKWRDGSRPSDLLATGWSLVKSTTGKVWNCVEVGDCVSYCPRSKDTVKVVRRPSELCVAICIVVMSSQAFFFA